MVLMLAGPVFFVTNHAFATSPEDFAQRLGLSFDSRLELGLRRTVYRDLTGPEAGFSDSYTIRFQDSELELSVGWRDRFSAAVMADLSVLFDYKHKDKVGFNDDFRFQRFIENAYVEIGNLRNFPFKLTIGKRNVVLGLHYLEDILPLSYTGPSSDFWSGLQHSEKLGVLGVTAEFAPGDCFSFVDTIGVSVYEDSDEDFDINHDKIAWQIRIRKHLSETEIVAAFGIKENDHLEVKTDDRKTAVLGLKTKLSQNLTGWTELVYFRNHPREFTAIPGPDSWALAVGGSLDVFEDRLTLVGQLEYIRDFNRHHVAGLRVPIGSVDSIGMDAELAFQVSHGVYFDTVVSGTKWKPDTSYVLGTKLIF